MVHSSRAVCVWVWVVCLLPPTTLAFLPTSLNYSDPDLQHDFCPDLLSGPTWDHKAITREALRLEVRRFFLESPPPATNGSSFTIPEDASLSQIFRAYYGPTSSPTRFVKAVNSITWSNAMNEASGQQRFHAALHMDGETIVEGHTLLQGKYQQLIPTIIVNQAYDFARELLGTILNGIQDFYSQTTWVEIMGGGEVLEGLGLPGSDIGEVAGPDDVTCTNCPDVTGECRNNVIDGSRLTSGYYEYNVTGAEGFIVDKPEDAGKCSHGGTMDSSVGKEARGGINKETSSPCFSPHHYLHQDAAALAISASEVYIGRLRDTIGDEHFRHLLDLYPGSALSIIIDTTGSMTYELSAVKKEAKLIVEKTNPELYVLVPYGDPTYGPVTETTDSEEFLEKLDDLEAFGGCCCLEEKFWSGLQLALTNTPDYSNIYCFTDAGGNDAELMEGVLALATTKHCKVSIIYSYNNGKEGEPSDRSCTGYELSGVPEYRHLASLTGGQFIEIDKFDIDDILGIMEDGVEESEVSLRMLDEVSEAKALTIPIDDSISQLVVSISGLVVQAHLSHPDGTSYDLLNVVELQASEGVEVVTHTPGLMFLKFANHSLGDWQLQTNSVGTNYSVAVSATSTLAFLAEFCELILEPPRPGYRVIVGRPLTERQYYVEVTLVGYLESLVHDVTSMSFVSKQGEVLSYVDYTEEVDDHFFILSQYLPAVPFYVQVDGSIESGQRFSRIFPTMVLSVRCSVELVVEDSVTAARPGETVDAFFRVENYGPEAEFDYFANDERTYITGWTPKTSTITSMNSTLIQVTFHVPSTAVPGTVSTVTVTASSQLHDYNVNTAITYFSVLSDIKDVVPPTCSSSDPPSCSGFDTAETCEGGTWGVVAALQDLQSGLQTIYSRPANNLTLDTFTEGTTETVSATFTASCCVREAEIIGRDMLGNIGRCTWDLGSLIMGSVIEFVAESVGETWVKLRWRVSEVREDLFKYSVMINHDYTDESRCNDLVCWKNETYLDACTPHSFALTPVFLQDGVEATGATLDTHATTLEIVPGPPSNPAIDYVTDTSTALSWDPPVDPSCLNHYQVCYTMFGMEESQCEDSSSNTITLKALEACTLYHVTVTSVSLSGLTSQHLNFDTNTDDAAPGAPENLVVGNQTVGWVFLAWDDPLDRAACVDRWMITYGEMETPLPTDQQTRAGNNSVIVADNYATINNLLGCTNYTFLVSGVSPKGLQGSTKRVDTTMEETEPSAITSLTATALDASSVWVLWTPNTTEECVDHYTVCLTDIQDLTRDCQDTLGHEGTFFGLSACADYDVSVKSVSPSGRLSHPSNDVVRTEDLPTSSPINLRMVGVTAHTASIAYDPPLQNPRCVVGYEQNITKFEDKTLLKTNVNTHLEEMISGLDACTDYKLSLAALTVSGYRSEAVTVQFSSGEDAPSAPRALTHLEATTTTVTLQWYLPKDNPLCAETYHLEWNSADSSDATDIDVSDHPPEVVRNVEGLESCTSYTFTVGAITAAGDKGPTTTYTTSTLCS